VLKLMTQHSNALGLGLAALQLINPKFAAERQVTITFTRWRHEQGLNTTN